MNSDKQLLLNTFVANGDDPRTYLRKPFLADKYYVASNGHVIIFIDNDGSIDDLTTNQVSESKKVMQLIAHAKIKPEGFITMPENTHPLTFVDCEKCTDGNCECFACGNETECEHCDGTGKVEKWLTTLTAEGFRFATHYLHKLKCINAIIEYGNQDGDSFVFRGNIKGIEYFGSINPCRESNYDKSNAA